MANNRNQHTLAVLVAFAVLCYWTEGCDDVSRQACHDLMSSNSDLCNDACLLSVCARTCGKCTLKCYTCHEIGRPEDCNTTLECPSSEYQCISVKSFTGQFQEVYKLGCAPGNVCDNADLETSCCTDDLCNNHKPLPTTTTTTTPITTTTNTVTAKTITPTSKTSDTTTGGSGVLLIGRRENSDPLCSEAAPAVCQELLRSDPNVCSKECIKSMCPVTCGKCKLCYNCPYVADSDLCNATSLCTHDELCYGLETVNSYQEHGFRLGCAPQPVCDSIATISTNTFGNRAIRTLVGGCCHDNLCNTHIKKISTTTTSTTTTTTTTTPTTTHNYCQCPSDGHTYHGHCFFVSTDSYTHSGAQTFCQSHCASLAQFSSLSELETIVKEIRSSSLHQLGRRFFLDTISATLAVLVAFAVLCNWTEGCDDVSKQACHDLMSSNSDLCNDACLSSVCARTCGKCTLKCYSCHEVNRPEDCNTTLECPSSDYQCISVKSFTGLFQEVYKLGCAPGNVCDNADLETSCCTDDLCNNHKTLPSTTTTTTTTTVTAKITTPTSKTSDTTTGGSGVLLIGRRENSDPLCSEAAPAVCQALLRSDPNLCSKECIKSMCPVSCGKCKLCYNCPYVADSDLCNATSLCSHDELCYGLETVNSYQEHGFRLGCAPQPVCDSIATISTNTFGNRATRTLVGGCCQDNLCNTHIKKITTTTTTSTTMTTTTTTTPTTTNKYCHCPSDGHTYHGHCFFVSTDNYTHNDAKTFCQSRCASLAQFSSESELEKIVNEIRSLSLPQSGRRFILDSISSVIFSLLYVSQHVFACDDVSTSACQKFAAQNPAMCDYGSCYATFCPRTCHKCASLKCYKCGAVTRPENCNTTIVCPSKDHECILAKSFTDDFREVFALGCALGSVCDNPHGETSCCSTDLCNNKTQPTTATTRKVPIRRGKSDKVVRETTFSCTDIHEDACRDLLSSNANICNTTCAKTLCPVTCGACKQCYECDYVSDSSQCTSTRLCQQGEFCYGIETINSYGEHGFRLGCAPDILCNKLTSMAVSTFGRKRAVAGACCDGNLCNDHLKAVTTATTTTTTTKPSSTTTTKDPLCQCSGTYHYQVNNECYFISDTEGTRQNGKDYCKSHCGQLATFADPSQLLAVTNYYYHFLRSSFDGHSHFFSYHNYNHMFVDAVKYHESHTHPTYIWESTGWMVSSSFLNLHNVNSTYSDMCAVISSLHSKSIQAAGCSDSHYALCQLRKQ